MKFDLIRSYQQTTSTNSVAKELLRFAPQRMAITALVQTDGRGRLGNTWVSLPGGLYITVTVQISDLPVDSMLTPLLFGVYLRRFLEHSFQLMTALKWPNDIMVADDKLCGILTEKSDDWLIVGIGLNVNQAETELNQMGVQGTSIRALIGKEIEIMPLSMDFIHFFEEQLTLPTTVSTLCSEWQAHAHKLNEQIRFRLGDQELQGRFEGISDTGELILNQDGERTRYTAGEIIE